MIRTTNYIRTTNEELEKIKQEAYDMALAHLISMVPNAPGGNEDKTRDIINVNFDEEKFKRMAALATIQELTYARQLQYKVCEIKTIPFKSWSEWKNILIEVGIDRYDDERGSLFNIKSDGWIHQFLGPDDRLVFEMRFDVQFLKQRYYEIRHKQNFDNFKKCPNEKSQNTWCMLMDMGVPNKALLNVLQDKDKEIQLLRK